MYGPTSWGHIPILGVILRIYGKDGEVAAAIVWRESVWFCEEQALLACLLCAQQVEHVWRERLSKYPRRHSPASSSPLRDSAYWYCVTVAAYCVIQVLRDSAYCVIEVLGDSTPSSGSSVLRDCTDWYEVTRLIG